MRIIFWLLFAAVFALSFAKEQTVKVRAQLICNTHGARNVLVELRERDTFNPDDHLSSTITDEDGNFRLTGTEEEFGTIRPYLRIFHNCDVSYRGKCHRITEIEIPEKYINNGEYEPGVINLNIQEYKEICDGFVDKYF